MFAKQSRELQSRLFALKLQFSAACDPIALTICLIPDYFIIVRTILSALWLSWLCSAMPAAARSRCRCVDRCRCFRFGSVWNAGAELVRRVTIPRAGNPSRQGKCQTWFTHVSFSTGSYIFSITLIYDSGVTSVQPYWRYDCDSYMLLRCFRMLQRFRISCNRTALN